MWPNSDGVRDQADVDERVLSQECEIESRNDKRSAEEALERGSSVLSRAGDFGPRVGVANMQFVTISSLEGRYMGTSTYTIHYTTETVSF
jgi:hypothetical protein